MRRQYAHNIYLAECCMWVYYDWDHRVHRICRFCVTNLYRGFRKKKWEKNRKQV